MSTWEGDDDAMQQAPPAVRGLGYAAAAWCLGFAGVSAWQVAAGLTGPPDPCLESSIWQGRLVSQADLYPGVPSRSLLWARCWSCHS